MIDLIFHPIINQVIERLNSQSFEHHNNIKRFMPSIAFATSYAVS